MPELPEVEIVVRGLKKKIIGEKIKDVWTDAPKIIKKPEKWPVFRKRIIGEEIKDVRRRAKNILIDLSQDKILLIHQKMTGHLLLGKWVKKGGNWRSQHEGPLKKDTRNRFLHFIIFFKSGRQMALSDMRKFAKIELWDKGALKRNENFNSLGPEPLDEGFTLEVFQRALTKRKSGKIKQVLMDQKAISGIGNIYASEILWQAKVYPFKDIKILSKNELKNIYRAVKKVLERGIKLKGASYSEFRRVNGTKGHFQEWGKVYDREGEECQRCGSIIQRVKKGSRSTYFCSQCQKIS